MSRVKRKEDIFFAQFKEFSELTVSAAELFLDIVENYSEKADLIPEVKEYETEGDEEVGKIMTTLNSSFITPFDRNDVMDLALKMDDVVDNMKGVSTRLDLFNVSHMRSEAVQMAELTLIAAKQMHEMIDRLPHYKDDPECMQIAISMGHIEDEGDSVYENGVRKLFQEEKESRPGHIVGWLRIFDRMEECLDSIDAVAGVVRSIVMKSA